MTLSEAYRVYLDKYDTPHNDLHINLIRVFVCLFFAWKALSRDFGFMGTVPSEFFYFYPIQLYRPNDIMLLTGVPVLMEIVTFHWVHWILGFPSEAVLTVLQFMLAGLAVLTAIAGRGPRRIFGISVYVLASYLWGFIFLSGQDIDSVMIYFGLLLILCLVQYEDLPIWRFGSAAAKPDNLPAGRAFSAVLLVYIIYYGLSGYNKIIDISLIEWFQYQLIQDVEYTLRMQDLGNYFGAPFPEFFSLLKGQYWLNYIIVPAVYISHISVFFMFFYRKHIFKFAVFYTIFHFVSTSVSIAFTGYLVVWWILLDWRKIFFGKRAEGEAIAAG